MPSPPACFKRAGARGEGGSPVDCRMAPRPGAPTDAPQTQALARRHPLTQVAEADRGELGQEGEPGDGTTECHAGTP